MKLKYYLLLSALLCSFNISAQRQKAQKTIELGMFEIDFQYHYIHKDGRSFMDGPFNAKASNLTKEESFWYYNTYITNTTTMDYNLSGSALEGNLNGPFSVSYKFSAHLEGYSAGFSASEGLSETAKIYGNFKSGIPHGNFTVSKNNKGDEYTVNVNYTQGILTGSYSAKSPTRSESGTFDSKGKMIGSWKFEDLEYDKDLGQKVMMKSSATIANGVATNHSDYDSNLKSYAQSYSTGKISKPELLENGILVGVEQLKIDVDTCILNDSHIKWKELPDYDFTRNNALPGYEYLYYAPQLSDEGIEILASTWSTGETFEVNRKKHFPKSSNAIVDYEEDLELDKDILKVEENEEIAKWRQSILSSSPNYSLQSMQLPIYDAYKYLEYDETYNGFYFIYEHYTYYVSYEYSTALKNAISHIDSHQKKTKVYLTKKQVDELIGIVAKQINADRRKIYEYYKNQYKSLKEECLPRVKVLLDELVGKTPKDFLAALAPVYRSSYDIKTLSEFFPFTSYEIIDILKCEDDRHFAIAEVLLYQSIADNNQNIVKKHGAKAKRAAIFLYKRYSESAIQIHTGETFEKAKPLHVENKWKALNDAADELNKIQLNKFTKRALQDYNKMVNAIVHADKTESINALLKEKKNILTYVKAIKYILGKHKLVTDACAEYNDVLEFYGNYFNKYNLYWGPAKNKTHEWNGRLKKMKDTQSKMLVFIEKRKQIDTLHQSIVSIKDKQISKAYFEYFKTADLTVPEDMSSEKLDEIIKIQKDTYLILSDSMIKKIAKSVKKEKLTDIKAIIEYVNKNFTSTPEEKSVPSEKEKKTSK